MSVTGFHLLKSFWLLSIVACIAILWWFVRQGTGHVHTNFLFLQFAQSYERHLASGSTPVESEEAFMTLVSEWKPNVDWNSCRIENGIIFDSWKTPIQIQVGDNTIHLLAAGRDRQFQTTDDISRHIPASR